MILGRPCVADAPSTVGPSTAQASEETSVLVLKDGGILTGRIRKADNRYVVAKDGSEIQVAAADVLATCPTLGQAYDVRRAQIVRPTVEAHLALATWCLRYGLLSQAARELLDARGLEPHHPRLVLLERRLAAASEASSLRGGGNYANAAQSAQGPHTAMGEQRATPSTVDNQVAVANFETSTTVSRDVVERFTRKVQPILVNNCTVSGCHQIGGQRSFQLDRALLHGLANRRSTQHNLAATLALVDREQPQLSPLLTVPRQPHGGMRGPIFGPRHMAAFTHLVDWVALVTRPETMEQPVSVPGRATSSVISADFAESPPLLPHGAVSDSNEMPALFGHAKDFAPIQPTVQFGARLHTWQPKDAFDPEIFNRRQRRRAVDATGESDAP